MLQKEQYLPFLKKHHFLPHKFRFNSTILAIITVSTLGFGTAKAENELTESIPAPLLVFNNNDLPSDLDGTL